MTPSIIATIERLQDRAEAHVSLTSIAIQTEPNADLLLATGEAARLLGLQGRTIQLYIREGRLPATKDGRKWRVRLGDVMKVIKEAGA
jgi:excisionase family DNA binding protein